MTNRVVQVALPLSQNKAVFDYHCEKDVNVGDFVKVSFRGKECIGIIWSKNPTLLDQTKIKRVSEVISTYSLKAEQITFIQFFVYYNMSRLGAVLKMLISNINFLKDDDKSIENYKFNLPELNQIQQNAFNNLAQHLDQYQVSLLDGVTGSGKTEVYCHIIQKILTKDSTSQVLVLMPEIMLTNQFLSRFKQRFGIEPNVWHSSVSKKNKNNLWNFVIKGKARLIIGTRSSLFLPFKNLKLIILDEEHDLSYKQEEGIIYHARDMAIALSYYNKNPIILCSATPSIETLYNLQIKKYHKKCSLTKRYADNVMPHISIVDMSKAKLNQSKWISNKLQEKVSYVLKQKQQAMLFLNRKGYAPIILCKFCGYKEQCNNCQSFLVTYKTKNKLICHHCGYQKDIDNTCTNCLQSGSQINCGPGVERIAEEVAKLWPNARTLIVTRESTQQKQAIDVLRKILNREVDIIIGTQILSKGLHFPSLSLVGVVDADIGLIGVDLRAMERTYQLLQQVSGRAGREVKGETVIQTYYPNNKILQSLKANNLEEFYRSEIEIRNLVKMPPFAKLTSIIISSKDQAKLDTTVQNIAKHIPNAKNVKILGPAPSPIALLRGRYRYRFLVKSNPNIKVQSFIEKWLSNIKIPSNIRLKIDVDPYNFL